MSDVIISNQDPRFVSKFWTELFSMLGMGLRLSIAVHPQMDGQSEVTIRVLENFFCVRMLNTVHPLGSIRLAEFAANNAVNISIGYTPFYLNQDSYTAIPSSLLVGGLSKVSNQAAEEALERMKMALRDAQSNLPMAQERMRCGVDKKRRTENYKVGDEVVLSTTNLRTYCPHILQKIKARWIGPFHITKAVSPVVLGLDLPPGWWIYPIFHLSKLKLLCIVSGCR